MTPRDQRYLTPPRQVLWRLAAATVLVLSASACATASAPSSTPPAAATASPEPSVEQAEVEFISDRHGYALQLPDGRWDVIELPGTWAPASAFDDAGVDSISLDGRLHAPSVKFSSQPLAEGATFEEWLADYDAAFSRQFPCEMLSHESADVAGEPARVARYLCNDGWIAVEAVLFYDERAYGIRVDGPIIPYGRAHREVLDEWIARLEFIDSGG